jgi:hypothetical protein
VLSDVCGQLRLPLAQCWALSSGPAGAGAAAAGAPALRTRGQPACVASPALAPFRQQCCDAALARGEGFPGRVWELGGVVWGDTQALLPSDYPLRGAAAAAALRVSVAVALALAGGADDPAWCVARAAMRSAHARTPPPPVGRWARRHTRSTWPPPARGPCAPPRAPRRTTRRRACASARGARMPARARRAHHAPAPRVQQHPARVRQQPLAAHGAAPPPKP